MKKKIFGGIIAVVIVALAAVNVNMNSQSENLLSDLALANVEALAEGEDNCHYTNGYKSWSTSSFFGTKKEFYDCCTVLRQGYSPEGSCN
jgi:hypothetical protein